MLAEFYCGQDCLERVDRLIIIPYNDDEVLIRGKVYRVVSKRFQYDKNQVTIYVREVKRNASYSKANQ